MPWPQACDMHDVNWAKTFTDTFVGGHDGDTLGVSVSPLGYHGEAPCSLLRGSLK
jgi:hypothetical protein